MKCWKRALITGASSGIGYELSRLLACHCQQIVLCARSEEKLQKLATELTEKYGVAVQVEVLDLAQENAAQQLWSRVVEQGDVPDLVVNNAGFGLFGDFQSTDLERELSMIRLNVMTLTALTKLAAQGQLGLQGGGIILNVSSIAGFMPGPRMSVYFATKAYVLSFSQAVDEEFRSRGVRVLALCPGNTATNFHAIANTQRVKWMHRLVVLSPRQVARQALRQLFKLEEVHVTGWGNQWMIASLRLLGRRFITRLSGKILR